jgi:hypothetical protein
LPRASLPDRPEQRVAGGRFAYGTIVEEHAMAAARHKTAKHKTVKRKAAAKRKTSTATQRKTGARYWSGRVTRESDALDLQEGVFKLDDPKKIAASLKRSAEESRRRKADPYRSALSMLTFYINRAGKNLPENRKRILERAKAQLKALFGRD